MNETNHVRISEIAYRLWEQNGSPTGRDEEFWYAAEHLLSDENLAVDPDDPVATLPLMEKNREPRRKPGD